MTATTNATTPLKSGEVTGQQISCSAELAKAKADLRAALDEIHAVKDIFWEQSVLFRKIKEETTSKSPSMLDIETLAHIGWRESESRYGNVEALLVKLGEEITA